MSSPTRRCAGCPGRAAVLGEEVLLVAEVDQGVEAVHRLDHDVAALAAVAAVGAAELHELLAAERDAAVAARAGAEMDAGEVEELHGRPFVRSKGIAELRDVNNMAVGKVRAGSLTAGCRARVNEV
jgi:hypothetical protein